MQVRKNRGYFGKLQVVTRKTQNVTLSLSPSFSKLSDPFSVKWSECRSLPEIVAVSRPSRRSAQPADALTVSWNDLSYNAQRKSF